MIGKFLSKIQKQLLHLLQVQSHLQNYNKQPPSLSEGVLGAVSSKLKVKLNFLVLVHGGLRGLQLAQEEGLLPPVRLQQASE